MDGLGGNRILGGTLRADRDCGTCGDLDRGAVEYKTTGARRRLGVGKRGFHAFEYARPPSMVPGRDFGFGIFSGDESNGNYPEALQGTWIMVRKAFEYA